MRKYLNKALLTSIMFISMMSSNGYGQTPYTDGMPITDIANKQPMSIISGKINYGWDQLYNLSQGQGASGLRIDALEAQTNYWNSVSNNVTQNYEAADTLLDNSKLNITNGVFVTSLSSTDGSEVVSLSPSEVSVFNGTSGSKLTDLDISITDGSDRASLTPGTLALDNLFILQTTSSKLEVSKNDPNYTTQINGDVQISKGDASLDSLTMGYWTINNWYDIIGPIPLQYTIERGIWAGQVLYWTATTQGRPTYNNNDVTLYWDGEKWRLTDNGAIYYVCTSNTQHPPWDHEWNAVPSGLTYNPTTSPLLTRQLNSKQEMMNVVDSKVDMLNGTATNLTVDTLLTADDVIITESALIDGVDIKDYAVYIEDDPENWAKLTSEKLRIDSVIEEWELPTETNRMDLTSSGIGIDDYTNDKHASFNPSAVTFGTTTDSATLSASHLALGHNDTSVESDGTDVMIGNTYIDTIIKANSLVDIQASVDIMDDLTVDDRSYFYGTVNFKDTVWLTDGDNGGQVWMQDTRVTLVDVAFTTSDGLCTFVVPDHGLNNNNNTDVAILASNQNDLPIGVQYVIDVLDNNTFTVPAGAGADGLGGTADINEDGKTAYVYNSWTDRHSFNSPVTFDVNHQVTMEGPVVIAEATLDDLYVKGSTYLNSDRGTGNVILRGQSVVLDNQAFTSGMGDDILVAKTDHGLISGDNVNVTLSSNTGDLPNGAYGVYVLNDNMFMVDSGGVINGEGGTATFTEQDSTPYQYVNAYDKHYFYSEVDFSEPVTISEGTLGNITLSDDIDAAEYNIENVDDMDVTTVSVDGYTVADIDSFDLLLGNSSLGTKIDSNSSGIEMDHNVKMNFQLNVAGKSTFNYLNGYNDFKIRNYTSDEVDAPFTSVVGNTVTFNYYHGLQNGDQIRIQNSSAENELPNGYYNISRIDSSTFTVDAGQPGTGAAGTADVAEESKDVLFYDVGDDEFTFNSPVSFGYGHQVTIDGPIDINDGLTLGGDIDAAVYDINNVGELQATSLEASDSTGYLLTSVVGGEGDIRWVPGTVGGLATIDFRIEPNNNDDGNYRFGLSSGSTGANSIEIFSPNSAIKNTRLSCGNITYINGNTDLNRAAQTVVIGATSGTDNTDTLLEVKSTPDLPGCFLLPRMSTADRDTYISSPTAGHMIFNTTTTKAEVYDGSTWQACW